MKDRESIVVDVGAAVETEQPEAQSASSGGIIVQGRGETACKSGEGMGGDGATTEIEGKQGAKSANTGDVVVAKIDAVWEGDEADEGEIGRVWYFLEERESGM